MATRCAIYARVSTTGQDTLNQLSQLREFAQRQGWSIAIEFTEHVSGAKSDSDQLAAMFASASRREFDILLFWSLDRYHEKVSTRR